ncbi:MAG: FAD-binding oxidoreductase [Alphaproteobacteria bacterium]|nr:FAD-binding oxidoreductase [Alphaproteobacteria bacterium]
MKKSAANLQKNGIPLVGIGGGGCKSQGYIRHNVVCGDVIKPDVLVRYYCTASGSQANKAKYSESVDEFINYAKQQAIESNWFESGFLRSNHGWNIWVSTDKRLVDFVSKNFADEVNGHALAAPSNLCVDQPLKTFIAHDSDLKRKNYKFAEDRPAVAVLSGGISALWAAYLMTDLWSKKRLPDWQSPPIYVEPIDIKRSPSKSGSSGQFHVSHATPMYTDPAFSALSILGLSLYRTVASENFERDNYTVGQIFPPALFNPFFGRNVWHVGAGYLWNGLKYKYQKIRGHDTILDKTIPMAISSGKIMDQVSVDLGQPLLHRKNTIRIAYNEAETKEMEEMAVMLKRYGIECKKISLDEVHKKVGTLPTFGDGGSAWEVEGDGNINPNTFEILTQAIRKKGGIVIRGQVNSILINSKSNEVSGVGIDEGFDQHDIPKETIIRTSKVYTSFGANAEYNVEKAVKLLNPIEKITPASGYSAYLLVEGDIKCPIDSNNSHFTPIKTITDEQTRETWTLVKTTCGGAIGTKRLPVGAAINNLWYAAKVIFPQKRVEIFSVKSCWRPINALNSGVITEIANGLFIGTGFGGKGITDSAYFASEYIRRAVENPHVVREFERNFGINPKTGFSMGSGKEAGRELFVPIKGFYGVSHRAFCMVFLLIK